MSAFPFLKLPAELRVQVYGYLLHALHHIRIDSSSEVVKDRISRRRRGNDHSEKGKTHRDMYKVIAIGLHPAILSANKQTNLEATRILYSENRFNFGLDARFSSISAIAAVIPFLEDRSECSRRLIREIEYVYSVSMSSNNLYRIIAGQDRVFEETCDYLCQNLQLRHVTLGLVRKFARYRFGSVRHEIYLASLHERDWIQSLLPLAKKLKGFTLIGSENAELSRAAYTYLNSKMTEASNTAFQIQITHLGPGSTA